MPLTPEEEKKLKSFFSSKHIPNYQHDRIIQIAGMMKGKNNRQQIMEAVVGDTNSISENMMKLRRWGIV